MKVFPRSPWEITSCPDSRIVLLFRPRHSFEWLDSWVGKFTSFSYTLSHRLEKLGPKTQHFTVHLKQMASMQCGLRVILPRYKVSTDSDSSGMFLSRSAVVAQPHASLLHHCSGVWFCCVRRFGARRCRKPVKLSTRSPKTPGFVSRSSHGALPMLDLEPQAAKR